jgi:NADH-quinone oxidoreductase subunit A
MLEPALAMDKFQLATYLPIFLYLLAVLGMVASMLLAAHLLGPRHDTAVKLMPYESGMDPVGDARRHFNVKYYLIAILFLVFDVELLFLYPWATVAYEEDGLPGLIRGPVFLTMVSFGATLVVAYIYAWRKGVFQWR